MNEKKEILKLLYNMAAYHDADLAPQKAASYAQDYEGYDVRKLDIAWRQYRLDPRNGNKFPTPGQILALIDDGRPSAQTSWAMIPHNDEDSFVWTEEMAEAWDAARPHLKTGNHQAAFFTYKETYERLLAEKRAEKKPVKWTPSFGYNKAGREDAVIKAVQKKQLTIAMAQKYCPEIEFNPAFQQVLSYEQKLQLGHNHENTEKIKNLISSMGKKEI